MPNILSITLHWVCQIQLDPEVLKNFINLVKTYNEIVKFTLVLTTSLKYITGIYYHQIMYNCLL